MVMKVEQQYLQCSEREGVTEVITNYITLAVMQNSGRLVLRGIDARDHWQCVYIPCQQPPELQEYAAVEANMYLTKYLCQKPAQFAPQLLGCIQLCYLDRSWTSFIFSVLSSLLQEVALHNQFSQLHGMGGVVNNIVALASFLFLINETWLLFEVFFLHAFFL